MVDFAHSASPAVQAQLDRLNALSPGADELGLDRITRLLTRLGEPQLRLPPVFHVAGTNGKGSTCAFLRAAIEAAGLRAHVYSSPHLVRFNERIRLAGTLIEDEALAALLAEVLDRGGDVGASFFEVTTAAALLAFSRTPADACIIEVGLGGRLDATNVFNDPAACGIAQLGIDHQNFLGDKITQIAAEKAGIARAHRPLLTLDYGAEINAIVAHSARALGARHLHEGRDWRFTANEREITHVFAGETLRLPAPELAGDHQSANFALAVAMLRAQNRIAVPPEAIAAAAHDARWPARMQRMAAGPLTALLPEGEIWLDGGHNPAAAEAISIVLARISRGRRVALIVGMLANKDAEGLLTPFAGLAEVVYAVPVPGHEHHPPHVLAAIATSVGIAARVAADPADALSAAVEDAAEVVLILGSLYLAGNVLAANGETPA